MKRQLYRIDPTVRVLQVPWPAGGVRTAAVDLTILASEKPAPLRALPGDRLEQPHLAVSVQQYGYQVGPLVVPGATPCLGCLDRHRGDSDPGWYAPAAESGGYRYGRRVPEARKRHQRPWQLRLRPGRRCPFSTASPSRLRGLLYCSCAPQTATLAWSRWTSIRTAAAGCSAAPGEAALAVPGSQRLELRALRQHLQDCLAVAFKLGRSHPGECRQPVQAWAVCPRRWPPASRP